MIRKASAGDAPELAWFKSSYSSGTNGESCVEIAHAPATVHVRDSKDIRLPGLALSSSAWVAFVGQMWGEA
ncbi:DUF397 domain-containing protein [Streptomyces caniscabiei]|uniref:DUF397 domain-containing protein n=1 Tax=Streptomyces caniscabiei TaxID=2746961 RepID=UPI0038F62C10